MPIEVQFISRNVGKAKSPPDPKYPKGIICDAHIPGLPHCEVNVPYPAPEVGWYLIRCTECDTNTLITVAGRVDDPTKVILPCKKNGSGQNRQISMRITSAVTAQSKI